MRGRRVRGVKEGEGYICIHQVLIGSDPASFNKEPYTDKFTGSYIFEFSPKIMDLDFQILEFWNKFV